MKVAEESKEESKKTKTSSFKSTPKNEVVQQPECEGEVFLKTKGGNLKPHYARIVGSEIYFYKHKGDEVCLLMHCLTGTFILEDPNVASI
jgi:hypothetical protein